jgi:hypothetical protein
MNPAMSVRLHRVCRGCGCLLILVLALLPPFVRAAGNVQVGRQSSAAFRLNRGFDVPVSKWKLTAPVSALLRHPRSDESIDAQPKPSSVVVPSVRVDHQHQHSPDSLRGPPAPLNS